MPNAISAPRFSRLSLLASVVLTLCLQVQAATFAEFYVSPAGNNRCALRPARPSAAAIVHVRVCAFLYMC